MYSDLVHVKHTKTTTVFVIDDVKPGVLYLKGAILEFHIKDEKVYQ